MNRKYCIFNSNKSCDNCGECEKCDLNRNKMCNNCGKCLEMEGFDMKAVKIDSIIENKDEAIEYDKNLIKKGDEFNDNEDVEIFDDYIDGYVYEKENFDYIEENMEFIDDIDGLRELLEDENEVSTMMVEEFPGLYKLNR